MPVLDSNNIDILREKVDAWREVETENLSRYCEILDHLSSLADEIDGHPAAAVRMLGEIRTILGELSGALMVNVQPQTVISKPTWLNPWVLLAILFITSILSSLITILATGQLRIP